MKTFAAKDKRARPAARRAQGPVTRPWTPALQAQRAEIRHILHGPRLQAKLKIGQPDDAYEREADRVADQVMRMPAPDVPEETPVLRREEDTAIRRLCPGCEEEVRRQPVEEEEDELVQTKAHSDVAPDVTPEVASRIQALRGGGHPLPDSARAFFEPRFAHDFSRIPVHAPAHSSIQPKLKVNTPGDQYEQEADQVADRVVQQRIPEEGDYGKAEIKSKRPQNLKPQIESGSKLGKFLDSGINAEMSRKIGFNFSNVRIHTDDSATYLNKRLNARAFTHGSDIYFNKGEYSPHSLGGKKLLAHELTHVAQQSRMTNKAAQREMIQCTSIGHILDSFFSPFSSETLWVMPENDNYTRIVRRWQPVIDAVNQAKADLEANCANWSANHTTDSSWTPGMTDPGVTDPNAHGIWVRSPPGTDPETCAQAFITYVTTKAVPLIPTVQTFELYTCSIGSFGIYATVDSIDCAAHTAQMNIWMYNSMDQGSFGRFADNPLFALSGMERQYMWWNWSESHSWGSSGTPGWGSGGGSSGW